MSKVAPDMSWSCTTCLLALQPSSYGENMAVPQLGEPPSSPKSKAPHCLAIRRFAMPPSPAGSCEPPYEQVPMSPALPSAKGKHMVSMSLLCSSLLVPVSFAVTRYTEPFSSCASVMQSFATSVTVLLQYVPVTASLSSEA